MKNLKNTSVLVGSLLTGALFSTGTGTAATLFDFDHLGTGNELRVNLLSSDAVNTFSNKVDDLKCGEGKCGEGKCGGKAKEAKCGTKAAESKAKEAKCGAKTTEGKCGEKKDVKKADAKQEHTGSTKAKSVK